MAAGCMFLMGCASVYTSRHLGTDEIDTNGIVYALPTTWLEIFGTPSSSSTELTITVATKELPDASAYFSLDHVSSAFATDELVIDVGNDQLLDRVYAKTEDTTDEIVVELAKSVSGVANFSLPTTTARLKCTPPNQPFSHLIDPFNHQTWPDWFQGCLTLTPIAAFGAAPVSQKTRPPEDCGKGVCYRAPVYYRLAFNFGASGNRETILPLLNDAPVLSVSVNRSLFVENKINLVFDKGVLSKMEMTKPSSALAVAALPLNVVKALLSAPEELLTLRIKYSDAAKNDIEAEKALIEAQRQIEELRRSVPPKENEKAFDDSAR
jgi:hypothetical protein